MIDLTLNVWQRYFPDTFNGQCLCCGKSIRYPDFHKGHILAKSKDGEYNVSNLLPLCMSCNSKMNNIDFFTFKNKYFPEIKVKIPIEIEIELLKYENNLLRIENIKLQDNISNIEIKKEEKSKVETCQSISKNKGFGKAKIKIYGFVYKNKEIKTGVWKEALKMVCDDLAFIHKDFSDKVKSLKYFSEDEKKFPTLAYKIKGMNLYVKTNLCASDVEKQTREILTLFGYSQDVLKFNYR